MRKILLFVIFILLLVAFCLGYFWWFRADSGSAKRIRFIVRNDVESADIWLIADTAENRSTTVWGPATVPDSEVGKSYIADVAKTKNDKYLFRMIDDNNQYYESDSIPILENYRVLVSTEEDGAIKLTIQDSKGNSMSESRLFNAALR